MLASVARTSDKAGSLNTLRRTTPCRVYWATSFGRMPVESRWNLQVASVKGPGRTFIPSSSEVTWEKYSIAGDGLVDFQYDESRSYRFYLDDSSTSTATLAKKEFAWPVRVYHFPEDSPQTIITFAFPVEDVDDYKQLGKDSMFEADDVSTEVLLAFNSDEHLYLGESVQRMIDHWALQGLIDGGAMVGTADADPENWTFEVPDSSSKYRHVGSLSKSHWHTIFPNPKFDETGKRWTSASLRAAVLKGKAAVLTVGHILMLGGDFYSELEDMKRTEPREPVHVMKGFDQDDPLACLTLDGMLSKWSWVGGAGWKMLCGRKRIPQSPEEEKKRLTSQREVRKDLKAIVDYVRRARGNTRASELHLLSRLVGANKSIQPQSIDDVCPWIEGGAVSLLGKLVVNDILDMINEGWDADFFHTVASNGHYLVLARQNYPHFSEHNENWKKFNKYHTAALRAVDAQPPSQPAIPAEALALTAFGLHFLTDAFSAGHMRVPRRALGEDGGLAAKVMHDTDNTLGLMVQNGFGDVWRAFGDDFLKPDRLSAHTNNGKLQRKILEISTEGTFEEQAGLNVRRCKAAVASAFKQLIVHSAQVQSRSGAIPEWGNIASLDFYCELGRPGPDRTDWFNQTIDQRIAYISRHRPEPLPSGSDNGKNNHPPLFNPDGSVNLKGDVYQSLGGKVLGLSWYDKATKETGVHYRESYFKFYSVSWATQNQKGWIEPTEKKIIDLFNKLDEVLEESMQKQMMVFPMYGP
jgi:hypothetical protein